MTMHTSAGSASPLSFVARRDLALESGPAHRHRRAGRCTEALCLLEYLSVQTTTIKDGWKTFRCVFVVWIIPPYATTLSSREDARGNFITSSTTVLDNAMLYSE